LHCLDKKFFRRQHVRDIIGLVVLVLSVQEKIAAEKIARFCVAFLWIVRNGSV
jgi:hypothetical protein